jgi:hypothetical protein
LFAAVTDGSVDELKLLRITFLGVPVDVCDPEAVHPFTHWTGLENVRVTTLVPFVPLAETNVGAVVSGAVAVA